MNLLSRIIEVWQRQPEAIAATLCDARPDRNLQISYAELMSMAAGLAQRLEPLVRAAQGRPPRVALVMGNSPSWLVVDLALMLAGAVEVPVPLGFSREQAENLINAADAFIVDDEGAMTLAHWQLDMVGVNVYRVNLTSLLARQRPFQPVNFAERDDWVCKIIHTSGTTSQPKGVRIRYHGLSALLDSLLDSIDPRDYRRYLSLVPLSLLIEQVTALYMPLCSGGQVMFLPSHFPLLGSPGVTAASFIEPIRKLKPSALTLSPALVEVICTEVRALEARGEPVTAQAVFDQASVPFMACGGAPVDADLLALLHRHGIVIYEGYGLSENSSVVAWNRRSDFKLGTVGRALPHVETCLAADGELLIRGASIFAGYEGADPSSCLVNEDGWLHTGDLAHIDDEGYITIVGRKKNIIITANGRNISPEWVESKLQSIAFVERAVLFGDGLEGLQGLVVINDQHSPEEAQAQLAAFSEREFSEVERVARYHIRPLSDPDVHACFTITGRPQREKIAALVAGANLTGAQLEASL